MPAEVLVRGGTSRWFRLVQAVGPLMVAVGLFLDAPWGYVIQGTGLLVLIIVEAYVWTRNKQRRWVEDLGDRFVVRDSDGIREIADREISSVGLQYKRNFTQGTHKSTTRLFSVWHDGDGEPITMENKIPLNGSDPLAELVDRIMVASRERCEHSLKRGQEVAGEGWALGPTYLATGTRTSNPESLPLENIAALDVVEEHVCLWRNGEERAFLRLPLSGRNCHFLLSYMTERLKDRPAGMPEGSTSGLGRILFERRPSAWAVGASWLFSILAIVIGATVIPLAEDGLWIGGVFVAVGLLLAFLAVHLKASEFRCHELGVYQKGLTGESSLRYQDVESFTYSATKMYHNGAYTGTNFVLQFTPMPGVSAKAIKYTKSIQNADDALDDLRDHVSRLIAARMLRTFLEQKVVRWTPNMTFHWDGIEYRASGFVKRKEAQFLLFDQLLGIDIQDGVFHLFEKSKPKSVMSENVSEQNFFPGYFMLVRLLAQLENERNLEGDESHS